MSLKEKILDYMRNEVYKPLTAEALADGLELSGEELAAFWTVMKELEENADVIKTRHDKFGTPERMNLVVGKMSVTSKGFGFVIPEVRTTPEETDVFIPISLMLNAMNNDRVVARVNCPTSNSGKAREGEIIRIVKRANTKIVGTFENSKSFGFVVPDDPKLGQDIFIAKQNFLGAKIGAKVVVEITQWPESRRSAEGKIIEVLGYVGEPGVDILSVIKKHDLPMEFPQNVEAAANHTPEVISPKEIEGRRDLRQLHIVTIDGDDAKDLDDGVYVERRGKDKFFLSVHIADVSHYVKEDAPLDVEAKARGTSVYLVDRVLPMLPPRLSNGICSLNAGEDRLAMSIEMEIDAQGKVVHYEIFSSVIQVYRRLTYNIVRKILVDKEEALRKDNEDILEQLENMEALCGALRKRRVNRGAIDFELPEIKVKLDEEGKPVKLVKRVRTLSESIIEECMLVANETVAEYMHKKKIPFMYRVHEQPEQGKLEKLNLLLATFNQHITREDGQEMKPALFQKVLQAVAGRPEERIISTVMLRSLKQARYEAQNLGHFGLAAQFYTHFTSPIRRYPDLIVHRLLRETFATGTIAEKRQEKLKKILPDIALHASQRERLAAEAERETTDMKKIEYMAQFIGDTFDGIISGVTAFGIFIELDNGVEGLVRVSSMEDDYYQYVEERYALVGERTNKVYRLGDPARIIVINANAEEKNIDFILEDNGTFVPMAPKKAKFTFKEPEKSKATEKKKIIAKPKDKEKEKAAGKGGHGDKWYAQAGGAKAKHKKKNTDAAKSRSKQPQKH